MIPANPKNFGGRLSTFFCYAESIAVAGLNIQHACQCQCKNKGRQLVTMYKGLGFGANEYLEIRLI